MTELEKLKQQKKEINEKIKELTTETVYYEDAKFYRDPKPGINNYNYVVSIIIPEKRFKGDLNREEGSRYSIVCRAETKEEAIKRLGKISNMLSKLYSKLNTEDN